MDEADRLALEAQLRAQIEGELRQEVGKTVNRLLAVAVAVAVVSAVTIYRSCSEISRFINVFEHLPVMALLDGISGRRP